MGVTIQGIQRRNLDIEPEKLLLQPVGAILWAPKLGYPLLICNTNYCL